MTTTIRIRQQNARRDDLPQDWPFKTRKFDYRLPVLVAQLKQPEPVSIITFQECTSRMRPKIAAGLGENWSWVVGRNKPMGDPTGAGGETNLPIFYDGLKWDVRPGSLGWLCLPSGLRKRYATYAEFISRSTGEWIRIMSLHLASGGPEESDEESLRAQQIKLVYNHLRTLDHPDNVIIGGDINDYDNIASYMNDRGYQTMFRKIGSGIARRSANTFNGYHPTKYDRRRIDQIFSGKGVKVLSGAVMLTDPLRSGGAYGSDHNGMFGRFQFTGPKVPIT
jgi:hypothetical protein